ncbi:MAG: right-handed parallel beta-helix repeat-containing protein [Chitinophagales bacterium]
MRKNEKIIAILVLEMLLLHVNADATNYYFSSIDGDDSRTSIQAQNAATPWKTLSKLNSFFVNLEPGDSVLFKRGDIFYGNITVTKSGSAGSPIILGAYGKGAKPIISGFTAIISWINSGGNIWESANAVSSLPTCNMVIVNSTFAPVGRWPNTGYRIISSHIYSISITDKSLTSAPNWTGGEVVIRKEHWIIDRNLITGHSGNTITYTSGSSYNARDGFGYFIQNHRSTLDKQNEWYYTPSTKKIGIYSTTTPANVQASTVENLIFIEGYAYVTIDNLNLQGANNDAIRIIRSHHITVQNCDISFSGRDGIGGDGWAGNSSFLIVQNCSINYSNNGGIHCWNDFTNAKIMNNVIQNSGIVAGMGASGDDAYEGVQVKADRATISNNQVINSGYIGIMFTGNSSIVERNFVNNFNLVKDDGGGIYTNDESPGRQIRNNIVIKGIGSPQGAGNPSSTQTEGIYLDDKANDVTVSGNTIAHISFSGIYVHNAHEAKIENNTVFDCTNQITFLHDHISPNDPIRNITMTGNRFISKTAKQQALLFITSGNDIASFGTADNNYYATPINNNPVISLYPDGKTLIGHSLLLWQSLSRQDEHSKKSPRTIPDPNKLRFEYNATSLDKVINLDGTYMDVTGTLYKGSITLAPFSSAVLIYVSGIIANHPGQ